MNPEQHDNLMRAIERDEAWLAAAMQRYPHPACPELAEVKDRLRAELLLGPRIEAGLPPAEPALRAAKAAVWGELLRTAAAETAAPRRRVSGWWRHRAAVATLAAAVVALIVLPIWQTQDGPPGGGTFAPNVAAQPGFSDIAAALTSASTAEFDTEVAAVAADIDDFYDAFTLAEDDGLDTEFDDLDADLDALFEEFDSQGDA